MRIINQNLKKGAIKVKIENLDDLWHLSHIIDPGDFVKGQTFRKIKLGDSDRKSRIVKKRVFVELKVEKISLQDDILRVSGVIRQGPEEIPHGSHHSLNVGIGSVLVIIKERWLKFQLDKLKEACVRQPDILICILDREEALFALSERGRYNILSSLKGDVEKKGEEVMTKGGFYAEIIKLLEQYLQRYKVKDVIVASPAFWKEELIKHIKDNKLKEKITQATCSSVDEGAINEVLKRQEVKEVLRQDRVAKETGLVEELLVGVAKDDKAAYGIKDVEYAANAGAVKVLLVSDKLIHKMREKGGYEQMDSVMKTVDQMKGEVHIIPSEHDAGKKLDGLGGIGEVLRYKVS